MPKVSTITDDRGEFYRFTIVNEDNEFESIFALVDDVLVPLLGCSPFRPQPLLLKSYDT